jgi:peroxiredoxin
MIRGLAVLLLACAACATSNAAPIWERPGLYGHVRPEMGPPQPGDRAPAFELPSGSGAFRSSTLRGSWVVLHFTATWCPFCDAEGANLGALANDYAARSVKVVLVDIQDEEARWAEYAKAHVASSVVALRDATGDVAKRFAPPHAQPSFTDRSQVVLDSTVIVDPDGVIRLFLLPDSKNFDPTFKAVRAELDRMVPARSPTALLAPERVVDVAVRSNARDVEVSLRIAPGYHVMSDHPSAPEYIPTRVAFEPTDGVTWAAPIYPPPTPFKLVDKEIATFQGDAIVRVPFELAQGATGERVVAGTLRYQSCTETSCLFPVTRKITATIHP